MCVYLFLFFLSFFSWDIIHSRGIGKIKVHYLKNNLKILLIMKKVVGLLLQDFPLFLSFIHSRVCRQFNIIVLSDEIYGLLNFEGKHQSMAKVYPEGTLVTSGFSKWSSAGGWRVGYIVVPSLPQHWSPFMTVLQSAASQTYSCAPAPMQFALAKVVL